jgi:RNA recognition motif-containing protein
MPTKLYVGNLPFSTSEEQLRKVFSAAGEIVSVQIITDKFTNKSRGFGFVEMATQEGANEAIKRFNGYSMDQRNLVVNEARPREDRGDRRGGGGGGGGPRGGGDRGDRRPPRSSYGDRDRDRY